MNIILFGPPGIGKSTIIGILKRNGIPAIDLEDVYPSKIRFQLPSMVDGVVFGGADLNPARSYPNTIKVLLVHHTQVSYDAQRAERDRKYPGKASQKRHLLKDWYQGAKYDYVVFVDNTDMYNHTIDKDPIFSQALARLEKSNG